MAFSQFHDGTYKIFAQSSIYYILIYIYTFVVAKEQDSDDEQIDKV